MTEKARKEAKFQKTTVKEAKEQLAASKNDGDNYVWGTSLGNGSKQDFESALANLNDGDAIVWGN
jgi:hypothetical protein